MKSFIDSLTLPTISDDQRMVLNAPISKEEALMALRRLQSDKSPGPDGLGSEVYKEFKHLLIDPLIAMYDHSFEINKLPQTLREANISLVLKKGKIQRTLH